MNRLGCELIQLYFAQSVSGSDTPLTPEFQASRRDLQELQGSRSGTQQRPTYFTIAFVNRVTFRVFFCDILPLITLIVVAFNSYSIVHVLFFPSTDLVTTVALQRCKLLTGFLKFCVPI